MNNNNVKRKGFVTDLKLQVWFFERGYSVSVPLGDNDKYDFILDTGEQLLRIQSKTCNLTRQQGYLSFSSSSVHSNRSKNTRIKYTKTDIDYFATMDLSTGKVYLVPVEECGNEVHLKLSKDNLQKNSKFAEDYLVEKVLKIK